MKPSKTSIKLTSFAGQPFILVIGIILSLLSSHSYSQNEGRWYNVEILIFKRLDQKSQTQELWRNDLSLNYPHFYEYLRSPKAQAKSHLSALNNQSYVLKRYENALTRNENFRILKHIAWSQKMASESNSPAIIISGGDNIGNHKELEGYIKIHIARFLHVTSNLWLTDTSSDNVDPNVKWPQLPPLPSRAKAGISKPTNSQSTQQTTNDANTLASTDLGFLSNYTSPYPILTLQNRTRMRSNELHYVDHPAMGMMIFMTPLDD
jgi:hypothetical protein